MKSKIGELRVWWIPQVPMEPFLVPVQSVDEAIVVLDTLAKYDLFQLKNNIKPDYANAGGLEVYGEDGWSEYYDDNGNTIDEIKHMYERFEKRLEQDG